MNGHVAGIALVLGDHPARLTPLTDTDADDLIHPRDPFLRRLR